MHDDVSVQELFVPFVANRNREIPVLGHGLHRQMDADAHRLATELDHLLPEAVCGYRPVAGGGWRHYRDELRRRFQIEDALAATFTTAARIDIRRFFPAISLAVLREAIEPSIGLNEFHSLIQGLDRIANRMGYPVPEGYAFARALANLVLSSVDRTLGPTPFVRWLDDYTIFGDSVMEVENSIAKVKESAAAIGLTLNSEKTEIVPSSTLKTARTGSLVELHGSDDMEPLALETPERQVRYLLRLAAEGSDSRHLTFIARHFDALPDSTFPRLAWYLTSVSENPIVTDILHRTLSSPRTERSAWATLRLAPVLWYLPQPIADGLAESLIKQSIRDPLLMPVVARVIARKAPWALDLLTNVDGSPGTERALALAAEEAGGIPSDSAFQLGPPVNSYL
jgi:hypothetical protein